MRISDWSSDVCSSDLDLGAPPVDGAERILRVDEQPDARPPRVERRKEIDDFLRIVRIGGRRSGGGLAQDHRCRRGKVARPGPFAGLLDDAARLDHEAAEQDGRSEEHTSELQSLMRISYAVFCL